jgi:chaperonin cofactor prefoldin
MSISSFTKEKLQELRDTTEKLKSSITTLKNTTESDIWLSDLKELKGKIGKDY